MSEEIIIINDEPFYRIPNGTSYDYAPIPKEFKTYFERLQQENQQLKERVDKVLVLANTILDLPEDKFCKYDTYLNSINEILEILKGDNQ